MTTGEVWFLVLVFGAFATLGVALAVATIVYRRSLSPNRSIAGH